MAGGKLGPDKLLLPTGSSEPSSSAKGEMYFDTGSNKLKISTGASGGSFAGVTFAPLGSVNNPAASAAAILADDANATDGTYYITANGTDSREVYCDMTNGGWMLAMVMTSNDSNFYYSNGYWTNNSTYSPSVCATKGTTTSKGYMWNEFSATYLRMTIGGNEATQYVQCTIPSGPRTLYQLMSAGSSSASPSAGSMLNWAVQSSNFQGSPEDNGAFPNTVYFNRTGNTGYGNCCALNHGVRIGTSGGAAPNLGAADGHGAANSGFRGLGGYYHYRDMHAGSCCNYGLSSQYNRSASVTTTYVWVK